MTEAEAISFLKSRGYDVFERVPVDWSTVSDGELAEWLIKLRNWQTDVIHSAVNAREKIELEIKYRARK